MAECLFIGGASRNDAVANIVFVHGLGGDKLQTWQATKKTDDLWPAWLAVELPHIAVYSLGYEASPSAWLGNAMPLSDRATNVLETLTAEQLGSKPVMVSAGPAAVLTREGDSRR